MLRGGVGTRFRVRLKSGGEKVGRLLYQSPDKNIFWMEVAGEGEIPLIADDIQEQAPEYQGEVVHVFGWDGSSVGGEVYEIAAGGDIGFTNYPGEKHPGPDEPLRTRAYTPAGTIKEIVVPLKAHDKLMVKRQDGTQVRGEVVSDDGLVIRLKRADGSEEDVTVQEGDLLAVSSPIRELETVQIPVDQIDRQDDEDHPYTPDDDTPWELQEKPDEHTEVVQVNPRPGDDYAEPEQRRVTRRPKEQLSPQEIEKIKKIGLLVLGVMLILFSIFLMWPSKKAEVQPPQTTPIFMVDKAAAVERCVKTSEGRLTQADCEKEVGELVKARK